MTDAPTTTTRLPWTVADLDDDPARPFHVVTVCRANEARSPLAARLLERDLEAAAPGRFTVASCGTRVLRPAPAAAGTLAVLRAHGIDASEHRSRPLDASVLARADLVLTAEARQVRDVLDVRPALLKRTFTLLELAWLAGHAETQALGGRRFVECAAGLRPSFAQSASAPDVADPVDAGHHAFALLELTTSAAVEAVADALTRAS